MEEKRLGNFHLYPLRLYLLEFLPLRYVICVIHHHLDRWALPMV
jgi:hypothetical protein